MIKEINLSNFFPIRAESEDGKIAIVLHKIIAGEVLVAQLRTLIGRELAIEQSELDVIVRNGELIVAVHPQSDLRIDEQKVANTAGDLISKLLPPTLRSRVTGKKLVYLTRESGIPLIGRIDFGIIDRGTNLIQVRPITGCTLDCPFCSVDSGLSSKTRITDFIVDPDYMVGEARKLCEFKGSKSLELHIDGQGEPTLYPHLTLLIKELSKIDGVDTISLQTNGTLLTRELLDDLESAGLSRINLSINSLDFDKAIAMSGSANYSLRHILDVAEYIRDSDIALLLAPLWVPGLNDDDISGIVQFVKKFGNRSRWPVLGIQNYLVHRHGRKVRGIKSCSMNHFRYRLEKLSRAYDYPNLVLRRSDFGIRQMESYSKPFRAGEKAEIEIVEPGRLIGEMVGVGRGRSLHVLTTERTTGIRKSVRIIRTKHNIFVGVATGKQLTTLTEIKHDY
jgi:uncharacterized Fe-S cluster-containing radical SAM superfamily enzyme